MDLIARHVEHLKLLREKKDMVLQLQYGDLVWCRIPNMGGKRVRLGHEIRGVFVLKVENDRIVCIPCTHYKEGAEIDRTIPRNISILLLNYGCITLPYSAFIDRFTAQLDKGNISTISSRLLKLHFIPENMVPYIYSRINLREGDIVREGEQYYLLDQIVNKVECTGYMLSAQRVPPYTIRIKGKNLYIHNEYKRQTLKKDNLDFCDRLSLSIVFKIDQARKQLKNARKGKGTKFKKEVISFY